MATACRIIVLAVIIGVAKSLVSIIDFKSPTKKFEPASAATWELELERWYCFQRDWNAICSKLSLDTRFKKGKNSLVE